MADVIAKDNTTVVLELNGTYVLRDNCDTLDIKDWTVPNEVFTLWYERSTVGDEDYMLVFEQKKDEHSCN